MSFSTCRAAARRCRDSPDFSSRSRRWSRSPTRRRWRSPLRRSRSRSPRRRRCSRDRRAKGRRSLSNSSSDHKSAVAKAEPKRRRRSSSESSEHESPKAQRRRSGSVASNETHISLFSVHSSADDSEQERRQVENRRRRIRATKRKLRLKLAYGATAGPSSTAESKPSAEDGKEKARIAERLVAARQKRLKRMLEEARKVLEGLP